METKDKRQLLREAELRMTEEVASLLKQNEDELLHWRGTTTDLMEALHTAFLTQRLRDAMGQPYSFRALVNDACRLLHVRVPSNPYEYATRGRRRKGQVNYSYMERYQYMLQVRGNRSPFWEEII